MKIKSSLTWATERTLKAIHDFVVSTIYDYKEISEVIPAAENSVVTFEVGRYSSIGFYIVPPTGGKVQFEGSFNGGSVYTPITLRQIGGDGYTQITQVADDYIGSVSCLTHFRIKVTQGGSAPGSIGGKFSKIASTIEGIEHSSAPHLFGYEIKKVDFEFTTAQTDTAILTPTIGKRWVITDILFTSDSVNTITIFDETNATGNIIIKLKTGQERFFSHPFKSVIRSSAQNNQLKVTSNSSGDFRGTIVYYEID